MLPTRPAATSPNSKYVLLHAWPHCFPASLAAARDVASTPSGVAALDGGRLRASRQNGFLALTGQGCSGASHGHATCAPESMAGTYVPVAAGVCASTAANSPAAQAGTLVFLRRWGRVVFPAPPPPRPSPAWRGGGAAHPVGGRCERPPGGGGRNGGTPQLHGCLRRYRAPVRGGTSGDCRGVFQSTRVLVSSGIQGHGSRAQPERGACQRHDALLWCAGLITPIGRCAERGGVGPPSQPKGIR